ncbi:hypothetical protein IWQ62_003356 [Dispira parvispora]|uniref:Uncharacterized protein n=1 Tax=Dispira parvispora TaxID=1520584 RepID=A0A9W8E6L9_9FUNG|nr:hypothetical protein IWQ62_003356 [Dispira parvispora]
MSWKVAKDCEKTLDNLAYDEEKKYLYFFANAVCAENIPDEDSKRAVVESFKDLTPAQQLTFFTQDINQTMYLVYLDYHDIPNRLNEVEEFRQRREKWLQVNPYSVYGVEQDDTTLDERQKKAFFMFPKGQYDVGVTPFGRNPFKTAWTNLNNLDDNTLLRRSPLLFALRRKKWSIALALTEQLSQVLRSHELGTELNEPRCKTFIDAYPLYFRDDVNMFGSPVKYAKSILLQNLDFMYSEIITYLLIAELLKNGQYESLDHFFKADSNVGGTIAKVSRRDKAMKAYAISKQLSPMIHSETKVLIKKSLGSGININSKKLRNLDSSYQFLVDHLLSKVVRINGTEVEVAWVDYVPEP